MADTSVMEWISTSPASVITLLCVSVSLMYRWMTRRPLSSIEIIVFTRYPVPGKAKTRLIPTLGESGAATLQICMTEHILENVKRFSRRCPGVKVTFQYNGGTPEQMEYWLKRKLHGLPADFRPQDGADLGDKLKNAVKDSFARGSKQVIVIGADIPGITEDVLTEAVTSMSNKDTEMVLGRAEDGGYYLIGFNQPAEKYLESIFLNIEWGTEKVFNQQTVQARRLGVKMEPLRTVLQDVDTADDLHVFEKEVAMTTKELTNPTWSITIPVRNEAENIVATLESVIKCVSNVKKICEIIIVDGGSTDSTVERVQELIPSFPVTLTVINSAPGRGFQLTKGGALCKGEYLLFLHADTKLPQNFDLEAAQCLQTPGNVAGAFRFQFDLVVDPNLQKEESHWMFILLRWLAGRVNARCKSIEMPYGDQGLFLRKKVYEEVGGYPPYRLMEDYILVKKLHTIGHVKTSVDYAAITSYRRWKNWGFIRVTGLNRIIVLLYELGVHPNTLADWYYRKT